MLANDDILVGGGSTDSLCRGDKFYDVNGALIEGTKDCGTFALTCGDGEMMVWDDAPKDGSNGSWVCTPATGSKPDGTTLTFDKDGNLAIKGPLPESLVPPINGDVVGPAGNTILKAINGQPVAATAPSSPGQVLKWNGTEWAPGLDVSTGSPTTYSNLGSGIGVYHGTGSGVEFRGIGNSTTIGATLATDTIDLTIKNNSITKDHIAASAGIEDSKLAVISTANKVNGSALTGTIGGTTSIDSSGEVATSGNLVAKGKGTGSGSSALRFYDEDDTKFIAFKSPNTIVSASDIVYTLPEDAPGNNGFKLTTNGLGLLSWTADEDTDTNTNAATLCSANQYLDGDGSCKAVPADTNTNAATECSANQYLDGDGSCKAVPVDTNTNAATICAANEYLDGDGTCKTPPSANWAAPGTIGSTTPNTGIFTSLTADSALRLGNGGNFTTINTNATGDYTLTLPAADGLANQVLQTNGSGTLTWVTQAAVAAANPTYGSDGTLTDHVYVTSTGEVGIGNQTPANTLSITGNASIGANYATVAGPTNGLIVEGGVAIGTTSTGASKLNVQGGPIQMNFGGPSKGKIISSQNAVGKMEWKKIAQGFSTAPNDLRIKTTSNNVVQIDFHSAVLRDGDDWMVAGNESVSVNISGGAGGIGARDSGSEDPNKWYYIWLVGDGTDVGAILSESQSSPNLPTGYDFKSLVGAAYNNSSSDFVQFFQQGKRVYLEAPPSHQFNDASWESWDLNGTSAVVPPDMVRTVLTQNHCYRTATGTSPSIDCELGHTNTVPFTTGTASFNDDGFTDVRWQTNWAAEIPLPNPSNPRLFGTVSTPLNSELDVKVVGYTIEFK
jgi:hypothetical protein